MSPELVWTAMFCLVAGCSGPSGHGQSTTPTNPRDEPERIRITDDVRQLHLGTYFNVLVHTSEGVVVIDPTSDAAAEHTVEMIRESAPDQPLLAIIYSHWHLDHATGANVLRRAFGTDVPIIAHERVNLRLDEFMGRGAENVPRPTQLLGDGPTELTFGDKTIELTYVGHAHSDNMLIARIQPDDVLYACDFVQNRSVGYSDLPGVDMHEQIAMLYRVMELDYTHTAFCHTPPGDRTAIEAYTRYFESLWDAVSQAIADGLDADATVLQTSEGLSQYRGWLRADEWLATNIRGMHRWLSENPNATRPEGPTPIPPATSR